MYTIYSTSPTDEHDQARDTVWCQTEAHEIASSLRRLGYKVRLEEEGYPTMDTTTNDSYRNDDPTIEAILDQAAKDDPRAASTVTSQITSVSYARLFSLGNYENERIEATAVVLPNQDPQDVLNELKEWVQQDHKRRERDRQAADAATEAHLKTRWELQTLEAQVRDMRATWERYKAFLDKTGIPTSASRVLDDIPF